MVVPLSFSDEGKTRFISEVLILSLSIIVLQSGIASSRELGNSNLIKSATFYSPVFEVGPGMVVKKSFLDVEFPKGHIGVKSFEAELVDEKGDSVPLYNAYLHHFFAIRYFENITMSREADEHKNYFYGKKFRRNDGLCNAFTLAHYWGLGADARRTVSEVPNPFAIELGTHPDDIPKMFDEEKWLLDILVIDTRGVKDRKGCSQCRCDLFNNATSEYLNTTVGIDMKPLTNDYKGGLFCCADNFQCKLKKGNKQRKKNVSLKYTVKWVDWDKYQVPLQVYILDVADQVTYNGSQPVHNCLVEYSIPENGDDLRYHIKKTKIPMKSGGYLIYGTAHVHTGIVNATLYGQDGRVLCAIKSIYGTGKEPGNEKGYAVGMTVCYPKPGSIKIEDGETLTVEFIHKNRYVTGLMGHFYIHLAEELPKSLEYY